MKLEEDKIQLVRDRILTVKKLREHKNLFHSNENDRIVKKHNFTNPFNQYSGLQNYLLLTCFDILGQEDGWVDFGSWIVSKHKKVEREEIFNKYQHLTFEVKIKKIHEEYNIKYSVRRSFDRFVLHHLPEESRTKLFGSIYASKRLSEGVELPNGSYQVPTGQRIEINDSEKLKILFKIRNSFTHKGTPIGSITEGMWPQENPKYARIYERGPLGFVIYREMIKSDFISYTVYDWPNLLIQILEEYLLKYPENNIKPI